MSSPESSGNQFRTPDSSPDQSEAENRAVEASLTRVRLSLNELDKTVQHFEESFNEFSDQDEGLQNIKIVIEVISEIVNEVVISEITDKSSNAAEIEVRNAQIDSPGNDEVFEEVSVKTQLPLQNLSRPQQPSNTAGSTTSGVRRLVNHFEFPNSRSTSADLPRYLTGLPLFQGRRTATPSTSSLRHLSSTTMSLPTGGDDSAGHDVEEAGDNGNDTQPGEPSPSWIGFARFTQNSLNRVRLDVTAVREQLGKDDVSRELPVLNAYSVRSHRWMTNVTRAEDDLRDFAYSGGAPQEEMDELQKTISDLNNDLDLLNSIIDTFKQSAQEKIDPQKDLVTAIEKITTSNRDIANSPMVSLPTFHGQTTKYAGFKENFKFVISKTSGPQELWATHLVNSLQGPPKEYIGDEGKWFGKYNELWEVLDDKYANRWLLATDTIKTFLYRPQPTSEPDQIKKYFYEQLDAIASVIKLEMTVEEVCINFLVQSLPEAYNKELRDGLRILQPNKAKAAFSAKEVRKVFNDTIGVIKDPKTSCNKGTLNFQLSTDTKTKPYKQKKAQNTETPKTNPQPQRNQTPQAQPYQNPPHLNHTQTVPQYHTQAQEQGQQVEQYSNNNYRAGGRGRDQEQGQQHEPYSYNNYRGRGRGGGSGRARGRGGIYTRFRCYVCLDNSRFEHSTFICPNFPTAADKRSHLIDTDRCPCCTNSAHRSACPPQVKCIIHNGDPHYTYLCGGSPHPGKPA